LNKTGTATGTVAVTADSSTTTKTITISSITGDGTLGISIASSTASDTAGNYVLATDPSTMFDVVNNDLPIASSVSIDSGVSPIILLPGTTTNVVCSGTVIDIDGYEDIASVTAKLYRSDVGAGTGDDNANHYTLTSDSECIPSGGSENTETYTCTFPVQFYADPTDAGSTYEAQNWICEMTPSDNVGAGTADTSTIEVATLKALSVSPAINYGSLNPGQNSTDDHIAVVTNEGNVATGFDISGNDLNCSIGPSIPVGNQQYGTSSISYGSGTPLSGTSTNSGVNLSKPTQSTSTVIQDTYWQVSVPVGVKGTCSGVTSFTIN
jgi:hypothetical protein